MVHDTDTIRIQRRQAVKAARVLLMAAKATGGKQLDGIWYYLSECLMEGGK